MSIVPSNPPVITINKKDFKSNTKLSKKNKTLSPEQIDHFVQKSEIIDCLQKIQEKCNNVRSQIEELLGAELSLLIIRELDKIIPTTINPQELLENKKLQLVTLEKTQTILENQEVDEEIENNKELFSGITTLLSLNKYLKLIPVIKERLEAEKENIKEDHETLKNLQAEKDKYLSSIPEDEKNEIEDEKKWNESDSGKTLQKLNKKWGDPKKRKSKNKNISRYKNDLKEFSEKVIEEKFSSQKDITSIISTAEKITQEFIEKLFTNTPFNSTDLEINSLDPSKLLSELLEKEWQLIFQEEITETISSPEEKTQVVSKKKKRKNTKEKSSKLLTGCLTFSALTILAIIVTLNELSKNDKRKAIGDNQTTPANTNWENPYWSSSSETNHKKKFLESLEETKEIVEETGDIISEFKQLKKRSKALSLQMLKEITQKIIENPEKTNGIYSARNIPWNTEDSNKRRLLNITIRITRGKIDIDLVKSGAINVGPQGAIVESRIQLIFNKDSVKATPVYIKVNYEGQLYAYPKGNMPGKNMPSELASHFKRETLMEFESFRVAGIFENEKLNLPELIKDLLEILESETRTNTED